MGVKPTYPSEKFGYVVPSKKTTDMQVQKVQCFTEKPNAAKAERLIKDGALWNGGVFAFRLDYISDIVNTYIQAESFCDIRNRYAEFPKISFDYEVVEKSISVGVIPFVGEWKDLGTWNTLCEELPSTHIGNVMMGEKNENTHAINELNIPLLCNGLKDVVIAASPDGIMVCGKDESENIKDYANKLSVRPMYEVNHWGFYRVLDIGYYIGGIQSITKLVTLKLGKNISYQIHHYRNEVWTIVNGEGLFMFDGETKYVRRGDVLNIPVEHLHAIKAVEELTFIEVQIGNPLIEEDIENFELEW